MKTFRAPTFHIPKGFTPPPITERKLCENRAEWTTYSDQEDAVPYFTEVCGKCPAVKQCEAYLQAYEQAGVPIFGVVAGRTWRNTCPKGHPMTPDNTYTDPVTGREKCRKCKSIRSRNYKRRLRGKDHAHAA